MAEAVLPRVVGPILGKGREGKGREGKGREGVSSIRENASPDLYPQQDRHD